MKTAKFYKKFVFKFIAFMLALFLGAGISVNPVKAAGGMVYTCTVNRHYSHPVTGVIEDSGGESSYATGQGMVEGCVYPDGIFELTDDGKYYLTIRMSLVDYTGNHNFQVQNVGDSGWSKTTFGVTGEGKDNNGATSDICIQVPSENCVVKGSMHVEPMGRDVVWYMYPDDFSEGNNTDMNATMVTSQSGSGSQGTYKQTSGGTDNSSEADSGGIKNPANSSLQSSKALKPPKLENGIESPVPPSGDSAEVETENGTLDSAEGLSLSTKESIDQAEGESKQGNNTGATILIIACITLSVVILMSAAAVIIYIFRKNWKKWGGGEDDEE